MFGFVEADCVVDGIKPTVSVDSIGLLLLMGGWMLSTVCFDGKADLQCFLILYESEFCKPLLINSRLYTKMKKMTIKSLVELLLCHRWTSLPLLLPFSSISSIKIESLLIFFYIFMFPLLPFYKWSVDSMIGRTHMYTFSPTQAKGWNKEALISPTRESSFMWLHANE